MGHSIIPPSSAWIWGAPKGCTGWVAMNKTHGSTEQSDAAAEGEAAHEIGEQLIKDATIGKTAKHNVGDWEGITSTNGVVFTAEMFQGAELYSNHVIKTMREVSVFGKNVHVEEPVKCLSIHELSKGTPDVWLFSPASMVLHIWDFKFGYGVVEAFENWQAVNYLSGILDLLKVDGYLDQHIEVKVHIVQPRAYHEDGPIRTWSVVASELRGMFNQLRDSAAVALGDNATFNTGTHCKNCPGRHTCPAASKASVDLYEAATSAKPSQLDAHNMGLQLSIVERAHEHLTALRASYKEQIGHMLKSGESVSGWGVRERPCNLEWSKKDDDVYQIGDMMGLDLRKIKPFTPKQALDAGLPESLVVEYFKPRKYVTVVEPVNVDKVKRIFN
jgi:hypothetical protein